jgi:hypothetical protein
MIIILYGFLLSWFLYSKYITLKCNKNTKTSLYDILIGIIEIICFFILCYIFYKIYQNK